jgi:septal ring factor EnvC (AmiA/AmiB activator)
MATYSCSFLSQKKSAPEEIEVNVSKAELQETLEGNQAAAEEVTDLRMELFSILYAMNSISDEALTLERDREINGTVKEETIVEEIHAKMDVLRTQIEEAKRKASTNAKLQADIERLELSLFTKEQEIRHLNTDIAKVDEKIKEAIQELKIEKDKIAQKNAEIEQTNNNLEKTKKERLSTDQRAWIEAGDAVVKAARTIPRPHKLAGEQSRAIVRAKQELLNYAITDCYNVAIRLYKNKNNLLTQEAQRKGYEATELFKKVTNYQDIGEDTVIDE